MVELRPPKRSLRAVPRLPFLRSPEASPSQPETVFRLSKAARIILGAGATSLVAALIIGSFSASGVIDMTLAITLLVAAWLVGMAAIIVSEPVLGVPPNIKWPASVVASVLWAMTLTGIGIYENNHFPLAPLKEGARMILTSDPLKRGDNKISINMINKGDLVARASSGAGTYVFLTNHMLSENEEDNLYETAKEKLPVIGTGIEFPKDVQRRMDVDISLTDGQFDEIAAGAKYLYVLVVVSFTDATSGANQHFLATFCTKYFKRLDAPTVCLGHNEERAPG